MSFGDEPKEKAEFNMAVSYLNRINILLTACDQASVGLDVYSWFHSLLATFRELSTWMDDQEIENLNNRIFLLNPKISKVYQKVNSIGKFEIPSDIYMDLHKFEMDLRKIANKAGLLMKIADDAYDALK